VYVEANPINNSDPSGQYAMPCDTSAPSGMCWELIPILTLGGLPILAYPKLVPCDSQSQQQPWILPAQTELQPFVYSTPTVTPQPSTPTPGSINVTPSPIQTQVYGTPTQTPRPTQTEEKEPFCWKKYIGRLGGLVYSEIRCDQKVREISITGVINLVRNGGAARFQVNYANLNCPNQSYCSLENEIPSDYVLKPGEYYESSSWGNVWYIYQGQNHMMSFYNPAIRVS
jgi:hypothetical protein